jgi:hypothetical protein
METASQSHRSSTAVLLAIMAAVIVLIGCAGVGIAYFLGFLGARENTASTPASMAAPGQQVTGTAPGVALLPGETLVTTPEPPKSAVPAPAPRFAPPPPPKLASPSPASPPPAAPPVHAAPPPPAPRVAQAPPSPPPLPRDYCVNCGVVTAIAPRGESWDVRVRFEDGSSQTLRYPEEPRFRVNDPVHLEDGRLVKD